MLYFNITYPAMMSKKFQSNCAAVAKILYLTKCAIIYAYNTNRVFIMSKERKEIFDSIFSLKDIKPSEQDRINPAYCNISAIGRFDPVKTVKYIWALTKDGEIIIGIDKPWEYPQAFQIDIRKPEQKKLWDEIVIQLKKGLLLKSDDSLPKAAIGHPTIVVHFQTEDHKVGTVIPGECVLGGDLYFNSDQNSWILNNRSGRFGRKKTFGLDEQQKVDKMLLFAAHQFYELDIIVKPLLYFHEVDAELKSNILGGSTKTLDELDNPSPIIK